MKYYMQAITFISLYYANYNPESHPVVLFNLH
jgi:hypothetical protein